MGGRKKQKADNLVAIATRIWMIDNHNLNNNEDDCCCEVLFVITSLICDCGARARIARHVSAIDVTSSSINVGSSTKIGCQLSVRLRRFVSR